MQAINECLKRTTDENLMGDLLRDALDVAVTVEGRAIKTVNSPFVEDTIIFDQAGTKRTSNTGNFTDDTNLDIHFTRYLLQLFLACNSSKRPKQ